MLVGNSSGELDGLSEAVGGSDRDGCAEQWVSQCLFRDGQTDTSGGTDGRHVWRKINWVGSSTIAHSRLSITRKHMTRRSSNFS